MYKFLSLAWLFFIVIPLRAQTVPSNGLGSQLFQQRRAAVAAQLPTNTAAVIFSGQLKASGQASPVPQPFFSSPDFFYLTGLHLPNSVLVIFPAAQPLQEGPASEILFLPDNKQLPLNAMGYGYTGQFGRKSEALVLRAVSQWRKFCLEVLDADMTERIFTLPVDPGDFAIYRQNYRFQPPVQVFFSILSPNFQSRPESIQHYSMILECDTARLAKDQRSLNAWLDYNGQQADPVLKQFLRARDLKELQQVQNEIKSIKFDFGELKGIMRSLREKKSKAEQENLRSIAELNAKAIVAGAKIVRGGIPELEVQAEIEYQLKRNGARPGRSTQVIAADAAGRYLYAQAESRLPTNGVVILDVAGRQNGYFSHIARTLPLGGAFEQKDATLYDAAATSHQKTSQGCKSGTAPTKWCTQQREALMNVLDANVLESGSRRSWRDEYAFVSVFPIGTALYEFENPSAMAPGMVFEVETLIAIPKNRKFKRDYQGRSVRLKDVVLIGPNGPEILTRDVPISRSAVEQMVGVGQ